MQFRVLSKVCRMLRGELMERRRTESCTCFQVESPYLYNIYEALTTLSGYSGVGSFFKGYEKLNWMKMPVYKAVL